MNPLFLVIESSAQSGSKFYITPNIHPFISEAHNLLVIGNNDVLRQVHPLKSFLVQDIDRASVINEDFAYVVPGYLHSDHHGIILVKVRRVKSVS